MTEHRVPMLSVGLRRAEDPEHSRDPRIRAVVTALRIIEPDDLAPAPRVHFRAELRAQLVAITPRIIDEERVSTAEAADAGEIRTEASPARARRRLGRPFAVTAIVLTALVLCLGGAVWMSQKAVPGDALYGLKRATESFRLDIATSNTEKANDYLEFAHDRVAEAKVVLSRSLPSAAGAQADGGITKDSTAGQEIIDNLRSANSDLLNATGLYGGTALTSKSAGSLQALTDWAPTQDDLLTQLWEQMPANSGLRPVAAHSKTLVAKASTRATRLGASLASGCTSTGQTDKLGPVPCTGPSVPTTGPTTGNQPTAPTTGTTAPGSQITTGSTPPAGPTAISSSAPGIGSHSSAPSEPRASHSRANPTHAPSTKPGKPTPTQPTPTQTTPSVPISIPTSATPTDIVSSIVKSLLPTSTKAPISVGSSCVSILGITIGNC